MYNNRQAEKYRLAYSVYLFNYPLTPEDVAFSIKNLWQNRNTTIIGSNTSVAAAICEP